MSNQSIKRWVYQVMQKNTKRFLELILFLMTDFDEFNRICLAVCRESSSTQ